MIDISKKSSNQQQTIGKPLSIRGIGLHTGKEVTMKLYPAEADYGIKFIRKDIKDNNSLMKQINLKQARNCIKENIISDGMKPKTECCIRALAQGIKAAHIIDGRIEHALLLEIFTNAGIGTMINA